MCLATQTGLRGTCLGSPAVAGFGAVPSPGQRSSELCWTRPRSAAPEASLLFRHAFHPAVPSAKVHRCSAGRRKVVEQVWSSEMGSTGRKKRKDREGCGKGEEGEGVGEVQGVRRRLQHPGWAEDSEGWRMTPWKRPSSGPLVILRSHPCCKDPGCIRAGRGSEALARQPDCGGLTRRPSFKLRFGQVPGTA